MALEPTDIDPQRPYSGLSNLLDPINELNEEAWSLRRRQPGEALRLALTAERLCGQLPVPDNRALADSLRTQGTIIGNRGDHQRGLRLLERALALYEALNDRPNEAVVQAKIGILYSRLGNIPASLIAALRAQHILEDTGQKEPWLYIDVAWTLAHVHVWMGRLSEARAYYDECVALFHADVDSSRLTMALNNISFVAYRAGDFEEAEAYARQALELALANDNVYMAMACRNNWAHALRGAERFSEALTLYKANLAATMAAEDVLFELANRLGMGQCHLGRQEPDLALKSLELALALARRSGTQPFWYECHEALARACEQTGDLTAALDHYRDFHRLKEEVYRTETDLRFRHFEMMQRTDEALVEAAHVRAKSNDLAEKISRLEALAREQDELLGIVAHDLRNPLAGIQLVADLLIRHDSRLSSEQRRVRLQRITFTIRHLSESVSRLLEMSRIDSQTITVTPDPVVAATAIQDTVKRYKTLASAKQITLYQAEIDPDVIIWADPDLVDQILNNLVSNAIKYSPPATTITLSAERQSDAIALQIVDQGLGLSEEDKSHLYQKFARLSARPTSDEPSIGLGLYIVKHLVELMNGSVAAASAGVNCGSTFTVWLPDYDTLPEDAWISDESAS